NLAMEPLRAARRIVVAICIAAGAAGLAGSLATKPTTVTALAATALAGLIAGLFGATQPARITGWLVSATAGNLLALVVGSLAGLPVYGSAVLVGAVAASQLLVVALITGYVEVRRHPDLSSWTAYGVALIAGFLPSLAIVLYTGQTPERRALLIVFAAATVAGGAWRRQRAPVVIGASVLIVAAL